MSYNENPFAGPVADEVPLARAPLIRVLAQIRFNDILKIRNESSLSEFQELLREEYPDFRAETTASVVIGPSGPQSVETARVWRFVSLDGRWKVSLEQNFVALETDRYGSRTEFVSKLAEVISAVITCFQPAFATRAGIRYIDRIERPEFSNLNKLVRNEVLGIADSSAKGHIEQTISRALFNVPEGKLSARWGMLPANKTHDAGSVEPMDDWSWVLDIDAYKEFTEERFAFEVAPLAELVRKLAARAYTFFRWSITDEFLRTYREEN